MRKLVWQSLQMFHRISRLLFRTFPLLDLIGSLLNSCRGEWCWIDIEWVAIRIMTRYGPVRTRPVFVNPRHYLAQERLGMVSDVISMEPPSTRVVSGYLLLRRS